MLVNQQPERITMSGTRRTVDDDVVEVDVVVALVAVEDDIGMSVAVGEGAVVESLVNVRPVD